MIEHPNRLVLAVRLAYYYDEYADTMSREGSYVEAFKPGPWLPVLLDISRRVKEDEDQKHKRWLKQYEREQAAKNYV